MFDSVKLSEAGGGIVEQAARAAMVGGESGGSAAAGGTGYGGVVPDDVARLLEYAGLDPGTLDIASSAPEELRGLLEGIPPDSALGELARNLVSRRLSP